MEDFVKVFKHEKYGQILVNLDNTDDQDGEEKCCLRVTLTMFDKGKDLRICSAYIVPFPKGDESAYSLVKRLFMKADQHMADDFAEKIYELEFEKNEQIYSDLFSSDVRSWDS